MVGGGSFLPSRNTSPVTLDRSANTASTFNDLQGLQMLGIFRGMSKGDVTCLCKSVDSDNDGVISAHEFLRFVGYQVSWQPKVNL